MLQLQHGRPCPVGQISECALAFETVKQSVYVLKYPPGNLPKEESTVKLSSSGHLVVGNNVLQELCWRV
jgi:hypothetical protein